MTLSRSLVKMMQLPSDILVASHPLGTLVSPTNSRYLGEALREIQQTTGRRVVTSPDDAKGDDDILVLLGGGEPPEAAPVTIFRRVGIEGIRASKPLFSGHLTSPWTLFVMERGKACLHAPGAPSARQSLGQMCKNAFALQRSGPLFLRKRLKAVEQSVSQWQAPQLKPATGYRISLFPLEEGIDRSKALVTMESRSVMTSPEEADGLTRIVETRLSALLTGRAPSRMTITDATAHVGGNTLSFSRVFGRVNAVEVSSVYHECLVHNVRLYKRDNVSCFLGDYTDRAFIGTLKQDAVFIDPPWGGVGYRMHKRISLALSNTSLTSIITTLMGGHTRMVVVKAPLTFDLPLLIGHPPLSLLIQERRLSVEVLSTATFLVVIVTGLCPPGSHAG